MPGGSDGGTPGRRSGQSLEGTAAPSGDPAPATVRAGPRGTRNGTTSNTMTTRYTRYTTLPIQLSRRRPGRRADAPAPPALRPADWTRSARQAPGGGGARVPPAVMTLGVGVRGTSSISRSHDEPGRARARHPRRLRHDAPPLGTAVGRHGPRGSGRCGEGGSRRPPGSVSYTHLTLPTTPYV